MRLATYVPGELIPLPLSGSIPELPHVEKLESRRVQKSRKRSALAILAAARLCGIIRAPAIVFAPIDVVPHLAARETHQRSWEFSVVHRKLRFGPFELSIGERVLRRDGQVLPLGGRALDILSYLADRPSEVIAKQELMDHVWSDVTVEEGSLRVHVAAIRKALGDGQFGNRYIANIKGRGYSFVGTVVRLEDGNGGGTNSPKFRGRIRCATP